MSGRKDEGGLNDFVKKLFTMLSDDTYYDVVRWTAAGTSFVVLNTNEFTKEILPRHFKHSNFASFVRQLNKYDFHKVKISNEEKQSYQYGDDAWEFQHPDFRKDDRGALDNIRRKAPLKKEPAYDLNSHYDAQILLLRSDLARTRTELRALSDKYRAVIDLMVAVGSYNDRQYRSIGVLVHCLNQAGIKVPPLDLPSPSLLGLVLPRPPANPALTPRGNSLPGISDKIKVESGLAAPAPVGVGAAVGVGAGVGNVGAGVGSVGAGVGSVSAVAQGQAKQTPGGPEVRPPPVSFDPPDGVPKFHVLLVEDDNVCIQLCRKFLMKYGCRVTVVTDGLNAISTVEHTKYDLVLMDIVMPNLDGATATSIIRSFDTKTPIIAMTGNIQDNDLVTYLQNGMLDILAKPFTKDDLYLILSKHLLAAPKQPFAEEPLAEFLQLPLEEGMLQPMEPLPMNLALLPMNQALLPMAQGTMPIARGLQLGPAMMDPLDPPAKKQRMQ